MAVTGTGTETSRTYKQCTNDGWDREGGMDERDGGLSTLSYSCGFACQQRVLKTLPGPGYICSKDGVVGLWDYDIHW